MQRSQDLDAILEAPRIPYLSGEQKDDWAINGEQFHILGVDKTEGAYGNRWEVWVESQNHGQAIITFPFGSWHTGRLSKIRDLVKAKGKQGPVQLERIELEGNDQRTYWFKKISMVDAFLPDKK